MKKQEFKFSESSISSVKNYVSEKLNAIGISDNYFEEINKEINPKILHEIHELINIMENDGTLSQANFLFIFNNFEINSHETASALLGLLKKYTLLNDFNKEKIILNQNDSIFVCGVMYYLDQSGIVIDPVTMQNYFDHFFEISEKDHERCNEMLIILAKKGLFQYLNFNNLQKSVVNFYENRSVFYVSLFLPEEEVTAFINRSHIVRDLKKIQLSDFITDHNLSILHCLKGILNEKFSPFIFHLTNSSLYHLKDYLAYLVHFQDTETIKLLSKYFENYQGKIDWFLVEEFFACLSALVLMEKVIIKDQIFCEFVKQLPIHLNNAALSVNIAKSNKLLIAKYSAYIQIDMSNVNLNTHFICHIRKFILGHCNLKSIRPDLVEIYEEFMRIDLVKDNIYFETIDKSTHPIWQDIRDHNIKARDHARYKIDLKKILEYSRVRNFVFVGKSTPELNSIVFNIYNSLVALKQVFEKETNPLYKNATNTINKLQIEIFGSESKAESANYLVKPDNLSQLEKILKQKIVISRIVTIYQNYRENKNRIDSGETLLKSCNIVNDKYKDIKISMQLPIKFITKLYLKNNPEFLLLGNEISNCYSVNGRGFRSMIERRIDDSCFMTVVINQETNKPISCMWLSIAINGDNKEIYLVADDMDINPGYRFDKTLRDLIGRNLLEYTCELATSLNIPFVINEKFNVQFDDFDKIKTTFIKNPWVKIGGFFKDEKYENRIFTDSNFYKTISFETLSEQFCAKEFSTKNLIKNSIICQGNNNNKNENSEDEEEDKGFQDNENSIKF